MPLVRGIATGSLLLIIGCGSDGEVEEVLASTDALSSAPANGFAFASDSHERLKTVPITGNGNEWRVVYSVPLGNVHPGERVAVRGEVQLSKCVPSEGSPCQRVTPFDPKFTAKIVLGGSADDASGASLSDSKDTTCNTRDHHCTVVIGERITGNLADKKFVNLVVAASGKNPSSQDLMKIEEGNGALFVTRIGASANAQGREVRGKSVSHGWMKIDNVDTGNGKREDFVTLRARVDGVKPGDILDVDAIVEAKIDDGSCDPLVLNQIFVTAKESKDPESDKIMGAVTPHNGTNCLDSSCTFRKSGAGELPKGAPSTVYVNVVSKAGRSCVQSGDRWELGNASDLQVRVRR